jgi:hypothetical protein
LWTQDRLEVLVEAAVEAVVELRLARQTRVLAAGAEALQALLF